MIKSESLSINPQNYYSAQSCKKCSNLKTNPNLKG